MDKSRKQGAVRIPSPFCCGDDLAGLWMKLIYLKLEIRLESFRLLAYAAGLFQQCPFVWKIND